MSEDRELVAEYKRVDEEQGTGLGVSTQGA
mgnify:CR=1 FL=1|jgi:hypothetical protein